MAWEAYTQAISGPREPGEQGVKGWKWQRVDQDAVPVAGKLGVFGGCKSIRAFIAPALRPKRPRRGSGSTG